MKKWLAVALILGKTYLCDISSELSLLQEDTQLQGMNRQQVELSPWGLGPQGKHGIRISSTAVSTTNKWNWKR